MQMVELFFVVVCAVLVGIIFSATGVGAVDYIDRHTTNIACSRTLFARHVFRSCRNLAKTFKCNGTTDSNMIMIPCRYTLYTHIIFVRARCLCFGGILGVCSS